MESMESIKYLYNRGQKYSYNLNGLIARLEKIGFKECYDDYNQCGYRASTDDICYQRNNVLFVIGRYYNAMWNANVVCLTEDKHYFFPFDD